MDLKLTEKLASLRRENGYTQSTLAEKVGVSRQTVSNWELGTASPTSDNLKRLGELYGVSVDYLMNDNAERPTTAVAVAERPEEQAEKTHRRKPAIIGIAIGLALAAVIALLAVSYHSGYNKGVEDTKPTHRPIHTEKLDEEDCEGTGDLFGW